MEIKSKNYSFAMIADRNLLAWKRNGKRHRDNGPASIEYGLNQFWFQDGKLRGQLLVGDEEIEIIQETFE